LQDLAHPPPFLAAEEVELTFHYMTGFRVHTLADHDFTRGLTEAQIEKLEVLATEVRFREDELILVEGQRSQLFYFILTGSAAIELRTPRFTVCLQVLGPGQAFGWSALLDHQDSQ
jgi:CRP-like cAMP-binding protein